MTTKALNQGLGVLFHSLTTMQPILLGYTVARDTRQPISNRFYAYYLTDPNHNVADKDAGDDWWKWVVTVRPRSARLVTPATESGSAEANQCVVQIEPADLLAQFDDSDSSFDGSTATTDDVDWVWDEDEEIIATTNKINMNTEALNLFPNFGLLSEQEQSTLLDLLMFRAEHQKLLPHTISCDEPPIAQETVPTQQHLSTLVEGSDFDCEGDLILKVEKLLEECKTHRCAMDFDKKYIQESSS